MSVPSVDATQVQRTKRADSVSNMIRAYFDLTKPRIMLLLLFTAYCAMLVGARGVPDARVTLWTLLGLAMSCGGSASLNMWYDRDIDALMKRTSSRPVPAGLVQAQNALWFGLILEVLSVLLLASMVNVLTALLSFGGFVYYVFVYTMWLKRRTPQNIVIGGGAGAFPPLVGWAAVTGHLGIAALLMFAIVFFWTPPHFWSLAIYKNDDYVKANIPMMPVVRGVRTTKWQSFGYTLVLLASSVGLYFTGSVNLVYLIVALLAGLAFTVYTVLLIREDDSSVKWAKKTFKFSLLYLPVVFLCMVVGMK